MSRSLIINFQDFSIDENTKASGDTKAYIYFNGNYMSELNKNEEFNKMEITFESAD